MRFKEYIATEINENFVTNVIQKIKNKTAKSVIDLFKNSFKKFVKYLEDNSLENQFLKIINKHMKTNFNSLSSITKKNIKESKNLNEDLKHWWMFVKSEAFPALSFYPVLKCFLELDKLVISPSSVDVKTMIVYGLMWVFLVSGKYVSDWDKWKKENPSDYKAEKFIKTI